MATVLPVHLVLFRVFLRYLDKKRLEKPNPHFIYQRRQILTLKQEHTIQKNKTKTLLQNY